jgi:predicted nucleic acid-binding protein
MAGVSTVEVVELDSNFLVAAFHTAGDQGEALRGWIRAGARVQTSAVAWSEYLCGPLEPGVLPLARKLLGSIDPFIEEDAELSSELFNRTGRRPRSHVDCMIAAHAIRRGAILATLNTGDFRRFEKFGLRIA